MIFEKIYTPVMPTWIKEQMSLKNPTLNMDIPDYLKCPAFILHKQPEPPKPLNEFQKQCIEYGRKTFPHSGGNPKRLRTKASGYK